MVNDKFKYIIWSPEYQPNVGGIIVLHKLCDLLNRKGYEAYLWPDNYQFHNYKRNKDYFTPLAKAEFIQDSIVIYPEIVSGNPLNAQQVVRWLLNKPGIIGGDGIFSPKDMIFYYSKAFTEKSSSSLFLQIFEIYADLFEDLNLPRKGNCYVRRKGKSRELVHDTGDSFEIIDTTPSKELAKLFNEKSYFYSYDNATFLSLQAAMCGCISIVIPKEGISAREWHEMSPTRKYGISYGFEEIDFAKSTMSRVKTHLKTLEDISLLMVDDFITRTQKCAEFNITMHDYEENYLTEEDILRQIKIQSFYNTRYTNTLRLKLAERNISDGNYNEAKQILQLILAEDDLYIDALIDLSVVYILQKRYSEADEIIKKVLIINPSNEVAAGNLAYLKSISTSSSDMDISINKFSSQREFKQFHIDNIAEYRARHELQMSYVKDDKTFYYKGNCIVCNKETDFIVDYMFAGESNGIKIPCWRERVICPTCKMNNRMRAFIHFVKNEINPGYDSNIYLTEQTTALYNYFSQNFKSTTGSEYLGTETPKGFFNTAGIRNEDIMNLTFPEGEFDFIFSLDVLEHVPDFQKAFEELYRVLKPNGQLVFSAPFARESSQNIIRAINEKGRIKHILPPEYHGDPINNQGCLCYRYYGWEILENLKNAEFVNIGVFEIYSKSYGYLGDDNIFFVAQKPNSVSKLISHKVREKVEI